MIYFERKNDRACRLTHFATLAARVTEPALPLKPLFRRSYRRAPASHQAIPKITAKMVAKAKAVRTAGAIIIRPSMLSRRCWRRRHRARLSSADAPPLLPLTS